MRLATNAEVWVCVLDASGRALVDGQILEAGAEEGPFRSGSFTVAFGNGEVAMRIDGKEARSRRAPARSATRSTPAAADALAEAERPTCV